MNLQIPPEVFAIFTALEAGALMTYTEEINADPRWGLIGDRYGNGLGSFTTYDYKDSRISDPIVLQGDWLRVHRERHHDVTLIAWEDIVAGNAELPRPFLMVELRRNIVARWTEVMSLIGKRFKIGTAILEGTKISEPCTRPAILAGKGDLKDGFVKAFENRGGICAKIVRGGIIRIGSPIVVID